MARYIELRPNSRELPPHSMPGIRFISTHSWRGDLRHWEHAYYECTDPKHIDAVLNRLTPFGTACECSREDVVGLKVGACAT